MLKLKIFVQMIAQESISEWHTFPDYFDLQIVKGHYENGLFDGNIELEPHSKMVWIWWQDVGVNKMLSAVVHGRTRNESVLNWNHALIAYCRIWLKWFRPRLRPCTKNDPHHPCSWWPMLSQLLCSCFIEGLNLTILCKIYLHRKKWHKAESWRNI